MNNRFLPVRANTWSRVRTFSLPVLLIAIVGSSVIAVRAQQRVSKRYPVGKNVRIELKNLSGTITVESWNRDEIKLTPTMESPTAHLYPKQIDSGLIIDVMSDNRGRADIGDVNFKLQVPVNSSVDLEL